MKAVAISASARLVATISKDGDLVLWQDDGKSASNGYSRLPEDLGMRRVLSFDHSRVLLLPPDKPPELVDLKRDPLPVSLPALAVSPDGGLVAASTWGGLVRLFDAARGEWKR